jgi:hypothetical protein
MGLLRQPRDPLWKSLLIVASSAMVGTAIFVSVGYTVGAPSAGFLAWLQANSGGNARTWAILGAGTGGVFGYFWRVIQKSG